MNLRTMIVGLLALGLLYAKDPMKKMIELCNSELGGTEEQLLMNWHQGAPTELLSDGSKRVIFLLPGRHGKSIPGQPGYATSTTSGQLDKYGNVTGTTTTTEHPPVQGAAFLVQYRVVFYVNPQGRACRWEYQGSSQVGLSSNPKWLLEEGRELRYDSRGRSKVSKVR